MERFESRGFTVDISDMGTLRTISYGDRVLLKDFMLTGNHYLPPDSRGISSQLLPSKNGIKVSIEREKEKMLVVVDSLLENRSIPGAAKSHSEIVLTPEAVTVSVKVITEKRLQTRFRLFLCKANIDMSLISGRGMLTVGIDGKRFLQLIPDARAVEKNCAGREIAFSLNDEQTLIFESLKNSYISLLDGRKWGGRSGIMEMAHIPRYSEIPVAYPAGTVFEWSFRIVMKH